MVEGARLEIVCAGNGTEGSNPSLSVRIMRLMVLPTLAREPRQDRKVATVAVTSVWRGLF